MSISKKKYKKAYYVGDEKYCHLCNKCFITLNAKMYIYKHMKNGHFKYFCSYTCHNKYLDKLDKKGKKKHEKI